MSRDGSRFIRHPYMPWLTYDTLTGKSGDTNNSQHQQILSSGEPPNKPPHPPISEASPKDLVTISSHSGTFSIAPPAKKDVGTLVSGLKWMRMNSSGHGKGVMRADVNGLSPGDRGEIFDYLRQNGIASARMVRSKTFNRPYVQVAPQDADSLKKVMERLACQSSAANTRPQPQRLTPTI